MDDNDKSNENFGHKVVRGSQWINKLAWIVLAIAVVLAILPND